MKRPAFQFYPGDWRRDPALASCSLAARGLWIDMMCIAHESAEYGVLVINGSVITAQQLARVVGEIPGTIIKLVSELEAFGVFSRDEKGAIYSRRMVKDEAVRNARASGGEAGKEFGTLGAEHGKKGGRPIKVRGDIKPPLEPPPSSSSSSSSSSSAIKEEKSTRKRAPPSRPDDVTEQVWQDWLQLRKTKRADVTQTVIAQAQSEAEKAGMPLDGFLAVWCARGSQGLMADWLKPQERAAAAETTYQRSMRERMAEISPSLARPPPGQQKPKQNATEFFGNMPMMEIGK